MMLGVLLLMVAAAIGAFVIGRQLQTRRRHTALGQWAQRELDFRERQAAVASARAQALRAIDDAADAILRQLRARY